MFDILGVLKTSHYAIVGVLLNTLSFYNTHLSICSHTLTLQEIEIFSTIFTYYIFHCCGCRCDHGHAGGPYDEADHQQVL